jgi:hypothetical protein
MSKIEKRFDDEGQYFVKIKNGEEGFLKSKNRMIQGFIPDTVYFWEYPSGSTERITDEEWSYLLKIN